MRGGRRESEGVALYLEGRPGRESFPPRAGGDAACSLGLRRDVCHAGSASLGARRSASLGSITGILR